MRNALRLAAVSFVVLSASALGGCIVRARPAPVYAAPVRPVYVAQPRPVYVAPQPAAVYVAPQPVYVAPQPTTVYVR